VARREIQLFAAALDEETRSNLMLLVSELVTNSLRHASFGAESWVELEAVITPEAVRVEVGDPGRQFPPAPDPEADGGWGLMLVDRVANRWGLARDRQTRVWFETDLSSDGNPAAPGWMEAVASWPQACRSTAEGVGRMLGPPQLVAEDRLVWDRGDGCRLVVERTPPG
jgi:anti-sigma regulatory factor (Ser/Thr protein kinase)